MESMKKSNLIDETTKAVAKSWKDDNPKDSFFYFENRGMEMIHGGNYRFDVKNKIKSYY
jgi:hypothetical protein